MKIITQVMCHADKTFYDWWNSIFKSETNHLVDEIDYETYDIDEYYAHGRCNMDENLFHEWKLKIWQHVWCGWKFMNIAEFNPHG